MAEIRKKIEMKKKRKKKLKKPILILINLVLLAVIAFSGYKIYSIKHSEQETGRVSQEYSYEVTDVDEITPTYQEKFKQVLNLNPDFKGWITFRSGLINLPVVQTTNNDYYLENSIERKYSRHGTVFVDYNQKLTDRNITLYGHYVYDDTSLVFSPLAKLADQKNYAENKYFSFRKQDVIDQYEIVAVIKYSTEDEPIYQYSNNDQDSFDRYVTYINQHRLYSTTAEITKNDTLMSLQTCVPHDEEHRWVVVGRKMGSASVSGV